MKKLITLGVGLALIFTMFAGVVPAPVAQAAEQPTRAELLAQLEALIRLLHALQEQYREMINMSASSAPTILPPEREATISVAEPNGGETWFAGARQMIRWNFTGGTSWIKGKTFKAEVWNGKEYVAGVKAESTNSVTLSMPVTAPAGSNYRVRVIQLGNEKNNDESDATFTVRNGNAPSGGSDENGTARSPLVTISSDIGDPRIVSMGSVSAEVARFTLRNQSAESVRLTQLIMEENAVPAVKPGVAFRNVQLYQGGMPVGGLATLMSSVSRQVVHHKFSIAGGFLIPANGSVSFSVKADIAPWGTRELSDDAMYTFSIMASALDGIAWTDAVQAMGVSSGMPVRVETQFMTVWGTTTVKNGAVPTPTPTADRLSCAPGSWQVPLRTTAYLSAWGGNGRSYSWSAPDGGILMVNTGKQTEFSYLGNDRLPAVKRVVVTSGDQSATCFVTVTAPESRELTCSPANSVAQKGVPVTFSVNEEPTASDQFQPGTYEWSAPDAASAKSGSGTSFTATFGNSTPYYAGYPVSVRSGSRVGTCFVRVAP